MEPGLTERLPWWRYLGPWDFQPVAVFFVLFMLTGWSSGVASAVVTRAGIWSNLAEILPSVALGTASTTLVVLVASWAQRRRPFGLFRYVAVALLAAVTGVVVRRAVGGVVVEGLVVTPADYIGNSVRAWALILLLQSLIGLATWRIAQQKDRAERALALAREQQETLIAAEEQSRRQVAQLLHDRVQAGLIAACLELQQVASDDPEQVAGVIHRLEDLRRLHVRRAAHALSPALGDVGLTSALEELAAQYEPAMKTSVAVDPSIDLPGSDGRLHLAAYRIVEQALLNAAVHGRARTCQVDVEPDGDWMRIQVRDDGVGLPTSATPSGLGAAMFNAWTRTLGGSWEWVEGADGGVLLQAQLRPSPASVREG